jgi:hypothetical protein
MYGKTKEETYQINKAFMLAPDRWPVTSSVIDRIYLKRYSSEERRHDLGQLIYLDGQWSFYRDDNGDLIKTGGPELIEEILQEGWVVD